MKTNQSRVVAIVLSLIMMISLSACQSKEDTKTTTKPVKSTTQQVQTNITVQVIGKDSKEKDIKIETTEKFLRGALEQKNLVKGEEGDYGLFVKTVDGYTVDDSKKEWWCFSKDGVSCEKGVDETSIEDGDHFEITLKTYD